MVSVRSRAPSLYAASREWSRREEGSTVLYSCGAAHNRESSQRMCSLFPDFKG